MDLADRRGIETTVYQPAEDSALLASAAESRLEDPSLVVEVGTGSGYVAARIAATTRARVVATDVNPAAARSASDRGLEAVIADLLDPFRDGVADAVVCNPPYLPTDPEVEWDDWMERALSGGPDGRAVINRLLTDVGRILTADGVVLLLVSSLTGVDTVLEHAGQLGFHGVAVAESSFPFETLTVVELFR